MQALRGIRVLHLTRTFPASVCSMYLADQGADVIRIDEPGYIGRRSAGDGAFYIPLLQIIDRNKRSIQLDLKADGGPELVHRLAADADVFIEGLRPGVADRLGIGYGALRQVNERLIYASLSGYGQDGPYSMLPGHDLNYLGLSGLLDYSIEPGKEPTIPAIPIGDMAGAMQLALGIVTALVARAVSGKGQRVDAAISDVLSAWMIMPMAFKSAGGTGDVLDHWIDRANSPYYNIFCCKDGRYVTLGCNEPWLWQNFCRAIGHPDLVEVQHSSGATRSAALATVRSVMASRGRDEWVAALRESDVPIAPVLSMEEAFADPHMVHRDVFRGAAPGSGLARTIGDWVKLSESPMSIRSEAPAPGQHTDEVLREAGFGESDIGELRDRGVVS
jgi:crotonobetainyl-CoA:carnitine CoA-transferase CaiB-like acyl-CoA transferase